MPLTVQQLRQFADEGYLFLPGCFSEEEVAILRDEAEQIYATNRQEVWREKTGAPRTAFAAHTYNEAFRLLGYHPRLIQPVEQVFGERLYMHQVQDQRQGGFRRRCLAVAPGLRHLGARRRHARAAGDEHCRVHGRGNAD
jgi:ectoine hydroxylase